MARAVARYRIEADDSQAQRTLRRVRSGFRRTAKAVLSFKGALLGAAGVSGFVALARQTVSTVDRIGKLATRFGTTSEELSELAFIAERAGMTFEELVTSLAAFSRNTAMAAQGTGEARDAFKQLGIDAEKVARLPLVTAFLTVGREIAKTENEMAALNQAQKIYGESGAGILQISKQGSAALAAQRDEARRLGVVYSDEMTDQAAQLEDAITNLTAALNGMVSGPLLSGLTKLAEALQTVFGTAGGDPGAVHTGRFALRAGLPGFQGQDPASFINDPGLQFRFMQGRRQGYNIFDTASFHLSEISRKADDFGVF